jgi:hypothetical protein
VLTITSGNRNKDSESARRSSVLSKRIPIARGPSKDVVAHDVADRATWKPARDRAREASRVVASEWWKWRSGLDAAANARRVHGAIRGSQSECADRQPEEKHDEAVVVRRLGAHARAVAAAAHRLVPGRAGASGVSAFHGSRLTLDALWQ